VSSSAKKSGSQLTADLTSSEFGIVVVSDIGCPWAHIAVHRLVAERARRGLTVELPIDHRAFPLELVNGRPTPKELLDAEIAVCRELEPDAGWASPSEPWSFPVTTLPALEAVQAAKAQSAELSATLDHELRTAMFRDWRCISVFPIVFEIAAEVAGLDVERLRGDVRAGEGRSQIWSDLERLVPVVPGSPTFVLPDGSVHHNPGIEVEGLADGDPVVAEHDPGAVARLVERARLHRQAD
jgi:predicted DsbA family dithiol-disulfide isomerase